MKQLLAGVLLVTAAFAGCIGGDDIPAATQDEEDAGVNRNNPFGNQTLVAFEETNATEEGAGGVDHHHDYWNGQTRVVVFERSASMEPYPDEQNRAVASFTPPQGALIYEATSVVEFTLSNPERRVCPYGGTLDGDYVCTDFGTGTRIPDATGGPSGLKLRYKHASTTQWIDVGEMTWGTPLPIKIEDPRHTDMPHATSSLWEFQVVSPNPQDVTLTFNAKAELVRGEGDVPLWPGHPDFYSERPTREVLNLVDGIACDQAGCTGLDPEKTGPVFAQRLVSYGTKSLHVWLNITEATFPNPATQPQSWFLFHRNATGRDNVTNQFDTTTYAIENREFYWIFPVDDNGMDSPYADGSRWNFELGASLTTPVVSCYGNCADWSAKYTLVAHATNEVLPAEAYHMNCLRDEECPESA